MIACEYVFLLLNSDDELQKRRPLLILFLLAVFHGTSIIVKSKTANPHNDTTAKVIIQIDCLRHHLHIFLY